MKKNKKQKANKAKQQKQKQKEQKGILDKHKKERPKIYWWD